jgi:CO/xanthine dehydrogenase FAD-binding subunit
MKDFDYFSPESLEEVSRLLAKHGENAKLMAGGTDLLVTMKNAQTSPSCLIDLKRIPGLRKIALDAKRGSVIGALVTVHEIEDSLLIRKHFPPLAMAASVVGSLQIRNKATLGGNLCHASPAADLAPPLIALGAKVRIFSESGERIVELEDFFLGPGTTRLKTGEILIEIEIPPMAPRSGGSYLKFSLRKEMALAVVGVATVLTLDPVNSVCKKARIALGAVAPTPIRAKEAERALEGRQIEKDLIERASDLAAEASRPIRDLRGSVWYRKEMTRVLVERSILGTLMRMERS